MGNLIQQRFGILVTGPDALEIEDTDPAQTADFDGGGRAHHTVHGGTHQRQVEPVGVDLPGDVHVLGVPGAPARHNGDVVEAVGTPARFPPPDLDLGHTLSSGLVDVPPSLVAGRGYGAFPPAASHSTASVNTPTVTRHQVRASRLARIAPVMSPIWTRRLTWAEYRMAISAEGKNKNRQASDCHR